MQRVVVIGAGVVGAAVARALAPTCAVTVLEQAPGAGQEASAQNAGMSRRLVADPVERALAVRSAALLEALDGPVWAELAPFRRVGAVVAVAEPGPRADALARAADALTEAGVRVRPLVDAPPALVGAPLHRAWALPDEGLLDAHALVHGCLREARAGGVQLRLGSPALGLIRVGDRVTGVRTADETLPADAVILAAGAWSAWLAADAGLSRRLVPLARHLLQTEPHPASAPDHPWCWTDDAGLYVRPEAGGWLLSPCDEAPVAPPRGPGSAGPVDPYVRALAADKLARLLPALASVRFRGGWTGLRTFAADRRPWLGPDPAAPGLWWAAGLGGAGVTCALAVGEGIAALLQGHAPAWLDAAAVDPGRAPHGDRLPSGAEAVLPAVLRRG